MQHVHTLGKVNPSTQLKNIVICTILADKSNKNVFSYLSMNAYNDDLFFSQEKYNFALVTNHFSSEANSLRFGDTLKKIRSVDNFQVRLLDFAFWT